MKQITGFDLGISESQIQAVSVVAHSVPCFSLDIFARTLSLAIVKPLCSSLHHFICTSKLKISVNLGNTSRSNSE